MTVDPRLVPADARAPPAGSVPERVLLAWHPLVLEKALAYTRAQSLTVLADAVTLHRGEWAGAPVGVIAPGPGAAATAVVADALYAGGARVIVGVGRAWRVGTIEGGERVIVPNAAAGPDAVTRPLAGDAALTSPVHTVEALSTAVNDERVAVRQGPVASVHAPALVTITDARRATSDGALVLDAGTAPLFAAAIAHDAIAGSVLVVDGALIADAGTEWNLDAGGSPTRHGWFPDADPAEVDRATLAAARGTLGALLGDLVADPDAAAGAHGHAH